MLSSSVYRPENGPTIDVFAGLHWNDYLSSQLDYAWNVNTVAITSLQAVPVAFYRQDFSTRQNSVYGNMLLYFRRRSSWVRPYLSVGTGLVRVSAAPDGTVSANGLEPPHRFDSTALAFQTAVGIDVRLRGGWAFRYSFAETIRSNPISERLSPPGDRILENFRNLFGFVKDF